MDTPLDTASRILARELPMITFSRSSTATHSCDPVAEADRDADS